MVKNRSRIPRIMLTLPANLFLPRWNFIPPNNKNRQKLTAQRISQASFL